MIKKGTTVISMVCRKHSATTVISTNRDRSAVRQASYCQYEDFACWSGQFMLFLRFSDDRYCGFPREMFRSTASSGEH